MRRSLFIALIGLSSLVFATGCGSDSDDGGGEPEPVADGIVRTTHFFGQNGNLWKPRGDDHGSSPGNLVVLLGAEFAQQYDNCEVTLATGEVAQLVCINNVPWTHTPFSCFANGDRQHWRATNFQCSAVAEVKVVCRMPNIETTFTVPDELKNQVCSRFG